MKRNLKVTIIKSQPSMWYNNQLNSIKEVVNTSKDYYNLVGHPNRIIFKCDALEMVT